MIVRAAALALVLLAALAVRRAGDAGALDVRGLPLALGFALIAASLAGELLERLRLPRVTGYLLFGLLCGPSLANIISRGMARELQIINDLAVALIAFIAGLEINLSSLRPRLAALLSYSAVALAAVYVLLLAAFWLAWPWLPILPSANALDRLAVAAMLATLVTSFSPTVTMAVVAESRASGPFTEFLVALVILADLALIVAFTLVLQLVRAVFGAAGAGAGLAAVLAWEMVGSLAAGALAGAVFAFYLRHVGREVTLVLLALCAIVAALGRIFHYEAVLAALAAGLVVENVAPPQGTVLKDAVERGALPVLIVFFAAAGASIQLDALAAVGGTALAVAALRAVAVVAGTRLATRAARLDPAIGHRVWLGLVSQAGVTLGLTFIVSAEFPEWGAAVETIILATIALHQLAGPALTRLALAQAGEAQRPA